MRLARLFAVPVFAVLSLSAQDAALSGNWHQTHSDNIAAAIDNTVADMNFIKRPIARGRLTKVNPSYQKVLIAISDKEVIVKYDDRAPIHMLPGGRSSSWTREDGEVFQVAAQVGNGQMIQTFKNEDGERTNVWKLSGDGKALTMNATIKSPKLPKALTYTITFGR